MENLALAQRALSLAECCSGIELLVLDVDGVLTPGEVVYGTSGEELKAFHVRDGLALRLWHQVGKHAAVLTGRASPVVARRAAELGIVAVCQGCTDKGAACQQVMENFGVEPEQVCVVGDDLPDLPMLRLAGLPVAVADACREVRETAHYVTRAAGGRGAIREVVELILQAQGRWRDAINHYQGGSL